DIINPDGSVIRPDRLILKDRSATVIDFKTGSPSDEHLKQVSNYGKILKQMGFGEVKKFLYYIDRMEVIEV
ncbi:MAG: hypothetical protein N2510_09270, partial [Ignavibacteria bacterium]|nr:hypothetical protein [Ignavibacteria bacterium]